MNGDTVTLNMTREAISDLICKLVKKAKMAETKAENLEQEIADMKRVIRQMERKARKITNADGSLSTRYAVRNADSSSLVNELKFRGYFAKAVTDVLSNEDVLAIARERGVISD